MAVFFVLQGDTIQFDAMLNDFNILVYVDSAGCTECRMRMPAWNAFMTRLNSGDSRIGLIFLVNGVDVRTVSEMAEKHGFTYPILAYKKCQYAFPENRKYQTFLLGSSNTVLALGDPIENESIAKLYYRIIGEEVGSIPEDSNITVSASRISLGVVRPEEEKKCRVMVTNNTDSVVVITKIETSCPCTTAHSASDTILPYRSVELNIVQKGDTVSGHFLRDIFIHFNNISVPKQIELTGSVAN